MYLRTSRLRHPLPVILPVSDEFYVERPLDAVENANLQTRCQAAFNNPIRKTARYTAVTARVHDGGAASGSPEAVRRCAEELTQRTTDALPEWAQNPVCVTFQSC